MQKEILKFIEENKLSPFNKLKTQLKQNQESIFKTKDAKAIYTKTINKLSENFNFSDTQNLWLLFNNTLLEEEIKKRQEFFLSIKKEIKNDFLKEIGAPKASWKPKYSIIVVTEDEETLMQLKNLDCPVQFLISQYDVESLNDYELIQVINCEQFSHVLERLPQTVFIDSVEDVYLERYLELLSAYKPVIDVLKKERTTAQINILIEEIEPLFKLLDEKESKILSKEEAEAELEKINEKVYAELKQMTLSGELLISMINKKELPKELRAIISKAISESRIDENILEIGIPLKLDEKALVDLIKNQSANEFSNSSENVKKYAQKLKELPKKLKELSNNLLLFDFVSGVSTYISKADSTPSYSEDIYILNSQNLFLENPKPITFNLNNQNRCSILTGANSGGKTTLLEHTLQLITLFQLGLPTKGETKIPLFSEIYYFAKNKGSANKGAFETLLTQMSEIKPGKKTLILADEIESVTEPGVAGKIISATAQYFADKGCFLIVATHLGQEIQKNMPQYARIDGIEAKGLDEFNELIVDHNPVLGKLASSTPQLIIEKMFKTQGTDYFRHLFSSIN